MKWKIWNPPPPPNNPPPPTARSLPDGAKARAVAPVPVLGMFFHVLAEESFPDELMVMVASWASPSGAPLELLMAWREYRDTALRSERDYVAALDELDDLFLSERGTPPGCRFDELVLLIEEFEARRGGYLLLPRELRIAARARNEFTRAASLSAAPDSRARAVPNAAGGARRP